MKKEKSTSCYKRIKRQRNESSRAFVTMTWKLVSCLAVFTVLTVIVVWVMQVLMSDTFYENVRTREISLAVQGIKECVDDGEEYAEDKINEYFSTYDLSLSLYKRSGDDMHKIHSAVNMSDSFLKNPSEEMILKIYELAKKRGGKYEGRFSFDMIEVDEKEYDRGLKINVVRADIFNTSNNEEYMILTHSKVTPVETTRKTFVAQFVYTIMFLLCIAILMAYILARLISKPLKDINNSAKELAAGNYKVTFDGRGYREVSELSDTLNYAASELAKNDNLRRELLANVSHDLRTPLTMIKGYGEVMRDIPGENNKENIQAIIEEASRLSELVNDLLDISKLESNTGKFEAELFNITDAIKSVISRYEKLSSTEKYDIIFNYDTEVKVLADRSMMLQVVYNLINNAINYGGKDRFVGVDQRIIIGESGSKTVRISVEDHGDGIETDKIPLIWDRYYKIEGVHRRAMIGTGLGLSIVKKALEKHGAVYGVDSEAGKGSTFWFELPVWDV